MKRVRYYIKKGIYFLINRPIHIHEPYINIIRSANAGWVVEGHLYCFDYAISRLPSDAPILEIGAYCGLSTNVITYFKKKHNAQNKLISVDTWSFEDSKNSRYAEEAGYSMDEFKPFVMNTYKRNVSFFSGDDMPIAIHDSSDNFFSKWTVKEAMIDIFDKKFVPSDQKISFAFIDGNHTYPFAKRDFENVDKYLEPGGFILFDDSADYFGWGSSKVAKEVSKLKSYRLIKKNPHYFFQKIK